MGGSGGTGFIPPTSTAIQKKIEQAREKERERFEGDVNPSVLGVGRDLAHESYIVAKLRLLGCAGVQQPACPEEGGVVDQPAIVGYRSFQAQI